VFADRYESQHWTWHATPVRDQRAYTLTGVALVTFKGTPGQRWNRGRLDLRVDIPDLPNGKGLKLDHWAPFVTLNAIADDHEAVDAGWAVDGFRLDNAGEGWMKTAEVSAQIAVRDADGFLLRVGYVIHLLGRLVDITLPPIK